MLSDIRFALRGFAKAPGFAVTALLTLAVGIGAATLTFTLVDAALLRPLPLREPERLVSLDESSPLFTSMSLSYVNFVDWRRENRTLSAVAAFKDWSYTLARDDAPAEHFDGGLVTAGFFEVGGAMPVLGREFTADEESPTGPRVAIIGYEVWQNQFGGAANVIGRTIKLDGEPHTIVGVAPRQFRFPDNAAIWTPVRSPLTEDARGSHSFMGVGRLKPGVTLEQARADLNAIAARLASAHPKTNSRVTARVLPLVQTMLSDYAESFLTLFAAVGCLLLITCVNLASLLLARGAAREQEIAIRAALGAGRRRIVGQLMVENLALGVAGAALGLLLASWGIDFAARALANDLPFWIHLSLDRTVLLFTIGLTLVVTVGFGLAPAWMLSQAAPQSALQRGGRSGQAARIRLMRVFVAAEIALALIVLTAAGLVLKSFARLTAVDPGFEASGVETFALTLPHALYPESAQQVRGFERIVDRLAAMPGAQSAALVSDLPLSNSSWGRGFRLEGAPEPEPGKGPNALNRVITPAYFATLRIPVKLGRAFNEHDTATSPPVAIVDETFVRQFFPNESPIGRRLHYGGGSAGPDKPWMEIVGVVGDVSHNDLQGSFRRPGLYVPLTQSDVNRSVYFAVRFAPERARTLARADFERAVAAVDRGLALEDFKPMPGRVRAATWRGRLVGTVLGGFAAVALLLAAIGIYGVTSFATSQRTREIGVRLALGAQPADVLRLVLRGGLRLVVVALAGGVVGAMVLTPLFASQLYAVHPHDPAVIAAVAAVIALVSFLATLIPACAAMRVEPMAALRAE